MNMHPVGIVTFSCEAAGCGRTVEAVAEEGIDEDGWFGVRIPVPDGWTCSQGTLYYCPDHGMVLPGSWWSC